MPKDWIKASGPPASPEQLALDQSACQGEMKRANLNRTLKPLIETVVSPPENDLIEVYTGCMAGRGYIPRR